MYLFGNMGNLIREKKTLCTPLEKTKTFGPWATN